ncbi:MULTISPECIES: hypothetical protein [Prochlorococcus]|uniref:hypothetical protein n=1 Tax=Prochlorococcus TaxID=1218 RepID=UPI00053399BD|nr:MULTISPECIES: hypothetical protein [Prochlorococcus]KGG12159.1 hypothetical protein EV05_1364 [Prochlorococcus sp. MIT 0601]
MTSENFSNRNIARQRNVELRANNSSAGKHFFGLATNFMQKGKLMILYKSLHLISHVFSTMALLVIAFSILPISRESRTFNDCVQEKYVFGLDASDAIYFCNGGR